MDHNYSTSQEMKYSWHSNRYQSYGAFKSICFWLGAIFWFAGGIFWIVRFIIYIFTKHLPLEYRLDLYATQMVCFGAFFLFAIALAFMRDLI